jgi:hypothetical protein
LYNTHLYLLHESFFIYQSENACKNKPRDKKHGCILLRPSAQYKKRQKIIRVLQRPWDVQYERFNSLLGNKGNDNMDTENNTTRVSDPPLPVENFSCISENWSNLNCSWREPYNPIRNMSETKNMYNTIGPYMQELNVQIHQKLFTIDI